MADQWLFRYDGGTPFAFSNDGEHYHLAPAEGGGYWAWRDRDWFFSQEGSPIGWVSDKTVFKHGTGKPLYFFGT